MLVYVNVNVNVLNFEYKILNVFKVNFESKIGVWLGFILYGVRLGLIGSVCYS